MLEEELMKRVIYRYLAYYQIITDLFLYLSFHLIGDLQIYQVFVMRIITQYVIDQNVTRILGIFRFIAIYGMLNGKLFTVMIKLM